MEEHKQDQNDGTKAPESYGPTGSGNETLKVGLVTTWNTKCGVANYSKYLVSHTPADARIRYTIFARKECVLVGKDEANVTRCWLNHGDIKEVIDAIKSRNIQFVHIMFNSSFFTASQLASMILKLREQQIEVSVTIHDPIETLKEITAELGLANEIVVFREEDVWRLRQFGVNEIVSIRQGILKYPDEDRSIARQLHGVANTMVIASTGFLLADKGVLEVIRSLPTLMSKYPDILYIIVCSLHLDPASEQYFIRCKDEVARLNLSEHVRFEVNYLKEEEVMALLHMADIIVMPRKPTEQPTSAALRFALSALRPVIVTDIPIFRDFGPEVYKIADCDPKLIADAVNRLYADPALCNAMMKAVRQRIATDSWESISRKYADMVRKQLSRPQNAELKMAGLVYDLSQKMERLRRDLQAARQELREERQNLEAELQTVYGSWSWRITAPLRGGIRLLRPAANLMVRAAERVSGSSVRFFLHYSWVRRLAGWPLRSLSRQHGLLRIGGLLLAGFPGLRMRLNRIIYAASLPQAKPRRPRRLPTARAQPDTRTFKDTEGTSLHLPEPVPGIKTNQTIYYWVDYTVTEPTNTGMQRVTRCLARALMELKLDFVPVCWDEGEKTLTRATRPELDHLSKWNGPQFSSGFLASYPGGGEPWTALHEQVNPESLAGAWLIVPEVTQITSQTHAPTLDVIDYASTHGMKTAFIFYDAIPLKLDEYAQTAQPHAEYMQHIALADAILPISEYSGSDLTSFYRDQLYFHPETLPVIKPILLPAEFYDSPRVTEYHSSGDELLVLCVGTIEPRKNQVTLLQAFQNICDRFPNSLLRLVLVGSLDSRIAPALDEAIRRNPGIEHLGYVDDKSLVELYKRCSFTVFPSVEEGYGLPIVESLWHGKPVICANFGSMEEIARGGGCLTVDTRSVAELEGALERMLFDRDLRSRLASEAVRRPTSSWQQYGATIVATLHDLDNPVRRIGIIYYWVDHTCIYPGNSGIQRVTRGLARALQNLGTQLVPVKWDGVSQSFYDADEEGLAHLSKWNGPDPKRFDCLPESFEASNSWLLIPELTIYSAELDLKDVVRAAKNQGLQTAIVFYDALPWTFVSLYPPVVTAAHAKYMKSLVYFDRVFPISNTSLSELRRFLFMEADRLGNIEEKLLPAFLPGEFLEHPRATTYAEPDSPPIRILCVSTIEPRKNHLALLESFEWLCRHSSIDAELVLVGGCLSPELEQKIKKHLSNNTRIQWLPNVDDAILARQYLDCHFTVYPSIEEGFGLPIVESLWYGKPCICRNSGAMAEVAKGGGCLTVDTTSIDELSKAIVLLAQDKQMRTNLGKEAVACRLKTWSEYALEILQHLARNTGV